MSVAWTRSVDRDDPVARAEARSGSGVPRRTLSTVVVGLPPEVM